MVTLGKDRFYDVQELTKKLGFSPSKITRSIQNGTLAGKKVGRKYYVHEDAVKRMFQVVSVT
jgi:excisionase family DNA binding protein